MESNALDGKRLLIVDDEPDIIETLVESLDMCQIESATDFATGKRLLSTHKYDAAVLDIMGVNGYGLLETAVENGIPSVILTAHALSADNFKKSIRRGAHAYLPKEKMIDLPQLLAELVVQRRPGAPKSGSWFARLLPFFNQAFGSDWKEADPEFWSDFKDHFVFGKAELGKVL